MARGSLLSVAQSRVGAVRAYKVIAFMVEWQMARTALGRDSLTVAEFRDWWKLSERTAYREQQRFRTAFPDETTPDRLLDLALASWDERSGVAGLAGLSIPSVAA